MKLNLIHRNQNLLYYSILRKTKMIKKIFIIFYKLLFINIFNSL